MLWTKPRTESCGPLVLDYVCVSMGWMQCSRAHRRHHQKRFTTPLACVGRRWVTVASLRELPVLAAAKNLFTIFFFESLPKVNGCAGRAAMLCSREDPGKSQPKHGMCVRLPLEISARDASALLVGVTPV